MHPASCSRATPSSSVPAAGIGSITGARLALVWPQYRPSRLQQIFLTTFSGLICPRAIQPRCSGRSAVYPHWHRTQLCERRPLLPLAHVFGLAFLYALAQPPLESTASRTPGQVLPGHNYAEPSTSTIATEKRTNPFVQQAMRMEHSASSGRKGGLTPSKASADGQYLSDYLAEAKAGLSGSSCRSTQFGCVHSGMKVPDEWLNPTTAMHSRL